MMKKIDLVYEYIFNRRIYLEHDLQQLQENVRYRPVGSVDCLELIIARERLNMFIEVTRDITQILKLDRGMPRKSNENAPKINFSSKGV